MNCVIECTQKKRSLRQEIMTQNLLVVNTQFNDFLILLKIHKYQRLKIDENRFVLMDRTRNESILLISNFGCVCRLIKEKRKKCVVLSGFPDELFRGNAVTSFYEGWHSPRFFVHRSWLELHSVIDHGFNRYCLLPQSNLALEFSSAIL